MHKDKDQFFYKARTETIVQHIDYVAQLVGPAHVGLGLDYAFDLDAPDMREVLQRWPQLAPPGLQGITFACPEQLPEITETLLQYGYSDEIVRGIMGENFLRVARRVWW